RLSGDCARSSAAVRTVLALMPSKKAAGEGKRQTCDLRDCHRTESGSSDGGGALDTIAEAEEWRAGWQPDIGNAVLLDCTHDHAEPRRLIGTGPYRKTKAPATAQHAACFA